MLVWPMAAKAPSTIEAMASDAHDLLPLRLDAGEARRASRASSSAMAATFGAAAKKAVTGVGAPS